MKSIAFVLGFTGISGGNNVVFNHALHLKSRGWRVHVFTLYDNPSTVEKWHQAQDAGLSMGHISTAGSVIFDIAVATFWHTVYFLERVPAKRYSYFVQSIETRFYPRSDIPNRHLARSSYNIGLPVITEATWIQDYLASNFSSRAFKARNGIDKSIFSTGNLCRNFDPKSIRILLEGPIETPIKNVPRTVNLVRKAGAKHVGLLTTSRISRFPGVDAIYSCVPFQHTPRIYEKYDILVKLSFVEGMFGPPLEMFHCGGTAFVYEIHGYDEYIKSDVNALTAVINDEYSVVSKLRSLILDPERILSLQAQAKNTAEDWPDWDVCGEEFSAAIEAILDGGPAVDIETLKSALASVSGSEAFSSRVLRTEQEPSARSMTKKPFIGKYFRSIRDRITLLRLAKSKPNLDDFQF